MRKIPYRSLLIGLLALVAVAGWLRQPAPATPQASASSATVAAGNDALAVAFARQQSKVQLHGQGRVQKTLPDDNQGSRHQRFILKLDSQHTVLVAHNIDLAPRLDALEVGDRVRFAGEYEWNERGGVLHWTHRDPRGQHPGGWLELRGRRYE